MVKEKTKNEGAPKEAKSTKPKTDSSADKPVAAEKTVPAEAKPTKTKSNLSEDQKLAGLSEHTGHFNKKTSGFNPITWLFSFIFRLLIKVAAIGLIIGVLMSTYMESFKDVRVPIQNIEAYANHPTRLVSKLVGFLADLPLPPGVRTVVYRAGGTAFGVNFDDIMHSLETFPTWNHFFGRKIIPRPIDKTLFSLVSPADSKLLSLREITEDSTILVKGVKYSLGHFLTGEFGREFTKEEIAALKFKKNTKLFSLVFYLSPKDYHRYHSMANCTIYDRIHFKGLLYPVKESYLSSIPGVYEINERVTLRGEWRWGNIIQSYVGATNVGSIHINADPELVSNAATGPMVDTKLLGITLAAGEEVGKFLMGSSVVSIVEVPHDFKWDVKEGDIVKYGQRVGS